MKITLIVGVSGEQRVRDLSEQIGQIEGIEVVPWNPEQFARLARLDAEYFSITFAERWGAVPVLDGAQVLFSSPADQSRLGLPKYIIAGGALSAAPSSPGEALSAVIRIVLRTVVEHNRDHVSDPIARIGLWEGWFNFEVIGLSEVGRRLRDSASLLASANLRHKLDS